MSFTDVLDREAAWLSTEPLAGYPALLKVGVNDGPFNYVGPRIKRLNQNPRQLHLYRERTQEHRLATGQKMWLHDLLAAVLWPQTSNAERAHNDQAALDAALDRLLARIRGTATDHTHGNRFFSIGELGGINPDTSGAIDVTWPDWKTAIEVKDAPLAAGKAYVVEVRYPAVEFIAG